MTPQHTFITIPNLQRCLLFACRKSSVAVKLSYVNQLFRETLIDFNTAHTVFYRSVTVQVPVELRGNKYARAKTTRELVGDARLVLQKSVVLGIKWIFVAMLDASKSIVSPSLLTSTNDTIKESLFYVALRHSRLEMLKIILDQLSKLSWGTEKADFLFFISAPQQAVMAQSPSLVSEVSPMYHACCHSDAETLEFFCNLLEENQILLQALATTDQWRGGQAPKNNS